jgi:3-phosphoglycerate kinase
MTKQTVRDYDLKGKRVLVRVDYNVPLSKSKVESLKSKVEIRDTLRIEASFPTLKYLLDQGCALVLISHLGRPEGKPDPQFSLRPVAAKLAELIGRPVQFLPDCVGPETKSKVESLRSKEIVLLENLRFHPEEEANDHRFAGQLAELAEVLVEDAFAAIHRAHASTVGVTQFMPAVAGLLVEKEVDTITAALSRPQRPLVAIVGGAKISTKIEVLANLIGKVDTLIIGGAMANTFLAAKGYQIGKSLSEADQIKTALGTLAQAQANGVEVILPTDAVAVNKVEPQAASRVIDVTAVEPDDIMVDVGPRTLELTGQAVARAGTIIWNGPLGVAELAPFAQGSLTLARQIMASPAQSLLGGGDTADLIDAAGLHDSFGFVSTGGGAALELMAGKSLPGLEALLDKPKL